MTATPGTFDAKIVIQSPGTEQDEIGAPSPVWRRVHETMGQRKVLTGRELESARRTVAECQEAITIRACQAISGINAAWRLLCNGVVYNILFAEPQGRSPQRPNFYRLLCRAAA